MRRSALSHVHTFRQDRRSAAAVEFALSALALFIFLLGIVNLGDLGLVLGALQRGVQGAARQAAVTAAANLSASTPTACPTSANIQNYFTGYASPPLIPNSAVLSYGAGSPWVSNDGTIPGSYVTVTATYGWTPLGFAGFGSGFTLKLTAAGFVMGTGSSTTC